MESTCEASGLMWRAWKSVCVTFVSSCHVCMIKMDQRVITLLNITVSIGFILLEKVLLGFFYGGQLVLFDREVVIWKGVLDP